MARHFLRFKRLIALDYPLTWALPSSWQDPSNVVARHLEWISFGKCGPESAHQNLTIAGRVLQADQVISDRVEVEVHPEAKEMYDVVFADPSGEWRGKTYCLASESSEELDGWYCQNCPVCQLWESRCSCYASAAVGKLLWTTFQIRDVEVEVWREQGACVRIAGNYSPGRSGTVAVVLYVPETIQESVYERYYFGTCGHDRTT